MWPYMKKILDVKLHIWSKVPAQIQQMNSKKQKQNLFKTKKAQQAL